MKTEEAYNEWSGSYDTIENKTRDLESVALKKVLNTGKYPVIIELGCGTGKNTAWLAGICKKLVAVDFSEKMLKVAKHKHQLANVSFIQADLTQPWNFNKANLLACSLVLEHIRDLDHIFQQAYTALHPKGQFYICELHPFKQLQGVRARFESDGKLVELEYFVHHISDFYQCAKQYGFISLDLQEWFDNEDQKQIPRLVSFLFEKQ